MEAAEELGACLDEAVEPVAIGLDGIEPGSVVADVVVRPRMTKLLQDAPCARLLHAAGVHMMDGQIAPMAAFLAGRARVGRRCETATGRHRPDGLDSATMLDCQRSNDCQQLRRRENTEGS